MSLRTLEKIEQGVVEEPKLVDVAAIAAVLGKTCADFVPDDEPEPIPPGRGRPTQSASEPEVPANTDKKPKGKK